MHVRHSALACHLSTTPQQCSRGGVSPHLSPKGQTKAPRTKTRVLAEGLTEGLTEGLAGMLAEVLAGVLAGVLAEARQGHPQCPAAFGSSCAAQGIIEEARVCTRMHAHNTSTHACAHTQHMMHTRVVCKQRGRAGFQSRAQAEQRRPALGVTLRVLTSRMSLSMDLGTPMTLHTTPDASHSSAIACAAARRRERRRCWRATGHHTRSTKRLPKATMHA